MHESISLINISRVGVVQNRQASHKIIVSLQHLDPKLGIIIQSLERSTSGRSMCTILPTGS